MDENNAIDVQAVVRQAIEDFVNRQQAKNEPAYKLELEEERRRREALERRMNELVEENKRTRKAAEELERTTAIRSELQRLGVVKVDVAFKAVRDEVVRTEDGRIVARGETGELGLREYLTGFVSENPEFLPARIPGGSGVMPAHKAAPGAPSVELERIRPGMSRKEMERARQEIVRVAADALKGQ